MRGKKTDFEFLSEFINSCVQMGMSSTEEFVMYAQQIINQINEDIKRVETSKITRSKLLDVIATFQTTKQDKCEDIKILSFLQIQNLLICKLICDNIKNKVTVIDNLIKENGEFSADIIFCIKQLIEHKVISRSADYLLRGDKFNDYVKFALKEE